MDTNPSPPTRRRLPRRLNVRAYVRVGGRAGEWAVGTYFVPFVPGVHASGPEGFPIGAAGGGAGGSGP